jgi:hypothetical protein
MTRRAIVRCIPSLRLAAVHERTAVGIGIAFIQAVILLSVRAISTLHFAAATGVSLGANTDAISNFDVLDIFADSDCCTDNLVAYYTWI